MEREKKRKDDKILVIEESSVKSLTNRYKLCRIYERRAKKNMEAYRSGHNGHDWKSCSLNGLRGSNPLASTKQSPQPRTVVGDFVFVKKGIRTGG